MVHDVTNSHFVQQYRINQPGPGHPPFAHLLRKFNKETLFLNIYMDGYTGIHPLKNVQ